MWLVGRAISDAGRRVADGRARSSMTSEPEPTALIVAGPTASGKSALAMMLAERLRGVTGLDPVIINADAMQCYRELRIITARPTPEDEDRVPHALYGVRPAAEAGSVAWWREAALAAMTTARTERRLPILTGGTGLYFASLTDGLAAIPPPTPAAREEARQLLKDLGPAALHGRLAEADPDSAARLRPTDSQRIARAWEVWRSTGRSLAAWQSAASAPAPWRFTAVLLDPPRPELRAAIATRLAAMLRAGCARGSSRSPRPQPGCRTAGDARPRGAGTRRPSARRTDPGAGHAPHRAGHRPVYQAPGHVVPPPRSRGTTQYAYNPCADWRYGATFGKKLPRILGIY